MNQEYLNKLKGLYKELDIPFNTLKKAKVIYTELLPEYKVYGGKDKFNRNFFLSIKALSSWDLMFKEAAIDGVELEVVSSYRGVDYQASIIKKKLDNGERIGDILKVNAAPGLSEHHTGNAIDISSTEENQVLTIEFEKTNAFLWLTDRAHEFNFYMSYPRNNDLGYIYEPWHWCYKSN
jgi:zinc D-Ala-D-Ala carboxypeptidase